MLGQRVAAMAVLADGPARPSEDDLRAYLGQRPAPWKVPERIRAVDAIPRNALTKIDRAAVGREPGCLTRPASE